MRFVWNFIEMLGNAYKSSQPISILNESIWKGIINNKLIATTTTTTTKRTNEWMNNKNR